MYLLYTDCGLKSVRSPVNFLLNRSRKLGWSINSGWAADFTRNSRTVGRKHVFSCSSSGINTYSSNTKRYGQRPPVSSVLLFTVRKVSIVIVFRR